MSRGRLNVALLAVALAAVSAAFAQRIWVGGPGRFGYGYSAKWAKPDDFDGSFLYCRGFYRSRYREAGGSGWNTDYPGADNNFSVRLMELTTVHVKVDADRQPNYVVVPLTDPLLYRCPMLFMEDVGTTLYSEQEVLALRTFFQKGGFLWVDDDWGSYAGDNWIREIGRVLSESQDYFDLFSPRGYAIGVNVVLYAMTH